MKLPGEVDCYSMVSTLIATFLFYIATRSCSSSSFFIYLLRLISIVISSVFWQHSLTALTMLDIVYEVISQPYKFKSTDERLLNFSKQLAR